MTNFFQRQRLMRRQTWLLGLIFLIAFLGIIAFTALWTSILFQDPISNTMPAAAVAVFVVVIAATLYRILNLTQGGARIAAQLGATPLPEMTTDLQLKRLRNVVEEIAIASSTPVPSIFVLDKETGINAFASGLSSADAAITVTRGALAALNRDELQAVIAHEFSHITNGDMRLNTQLVGALFGISVIGLIGVRVLRVRSSGKNAAGIIMFGLGLIVIGYVGLFASRLIKAGINRQREYLADACAVQYTRQNTGLSGALKKIAGVKYGSAITNDEAAEFSHMFFSQGFALSSFLATHPPVLDRIKVLEPDFDTSQIEAMRESWLITPPDGAAEDMALGFTDAGAVAAPNKITIEPAAVADQVGTSHAENYQQAKVIIDNIPEPLRQAARNYYSVIPLLFCLMSSTDPAIRSRQLDIIKSRHSAKTLENTEVLFPLVRSMSVRLRLPLVMLAFPALRQCPKEKLNQVNKTLNLLINADEHVSLFEYLFTHLLSVQINDFLNPANVVHDGNNTIQSNVDAVSQLISVMAQAGQNQHDEAQLAYQAGMDIAAPYTIVPYAPTTAYAAALDPVWPVLNGLNMESKQTLLHALVATMLHENTITQDESDLLRAVCASLHIPLPMLVDNPS